MSPFERVVVTGAGGFVGAALAARLGNRFAPLPMSGADWEARLAAAELAGATIFHLAARAHEVADGDEAAYLRDNADKTRRLAEAAAAAGARRLVFLSTIKVNGEETQDRPFRAEDAPRPEGAYARSKLAAERALAQVAAARGLAACTVRAPLVYGPRPRGNLLALLRLADTPWPLPFGAIENRRSFVHADDLARLLVDCAVHPHAAGRTYLAAHAEAISTPVLVAALRESLGRPARLFGVAPRSLEAAAALVGAGERMRRLTRSLEVDPGAARLELGWEACVGPRASIDEMARAWRASRAP